jgi:hypothetical protein
MKISELKEKLLTHETVSVEMMRNPAKLSEWIIWIRDNSGKSNLLVDEDEVILATADMNQSLSLLRTIGIKQANVVL